MVTETLRLATEDSQNPDLRDRAYIYWRMLSSDPEATKQVVLGDKPSLRYESTATDPALLETLLGELSLVSSILHRQPKMFLRSSLLVAGEEGGEAGEEFAEQMDKIKQQTAAVERGEDIAEAPQVIANDLIDASPSNQQPGALIDLL